MNEPNAPGWIPAGHGSREVHIEDGAPCDAREDAWAFTPEHLASVGRALRQVEDGRLHSESADEIGQDDSDEAESSLRGAIVEAAE